MEQLTQNLKDGAMQLLEVPFPALEAGHVLVRNHFSVISAGTEGKTVKDARLGYIGKARARQEEVKKVIRTARTQGVMKTYHMVMDRLNAPSPLGYSCAGEVIAIGPDVNEFKVGDRVACGGGSAVHSEVVAIPKNLCAKVPEGIPMQEAAFATVAAIALQGVRQADLRLGENAVVIGLGLIGQLTIQLLRAAGVRVVGIDIDDRQVQLAQERGADLAMNRNREDLETAISEFTNGAGTDSVIITAGTSSSDPVDLAGILCRRKGKVVIVGAVPTGFQRKHYYRKELDLRMSSSYGPGRYDREYEEKGIDYPIGYVRWTENRNQQAFLDLLGAQKISLEGLLTHEFQFEKAPDAYQLILEKTEPFVGIVLKYDLEKSLSAQAVVRRSGTSDAAKGIGFIGAGSFARNFLLPNLKDKVTLTGVATNRSNTARDIADKYGFSRASCEAQEVLDADDTGSIFIATRHNTHARFVLEALKRNKNVFVEKPLCLGEEELEAIRESYNRQNCQLIVGFNRRFAPMVETIAKELPDDAPKALHFRINAGNLPGDHWVHDPKVGGGRILGEACHFIDLARFLAGSPYRSVSATALPDANNLLDSVSIQLDFMNGSTASISYYSNGNAKMSKEYYEVFCRGKVWQLDDFKTLTTHGNSSKVVKSSTQDKGHAKEMLLVSSSLVQGGKEVIPFSESYEAMRATFAVLESIRHRGERIDILQADIQD